MASLTPDSSSEVRRPAFTRTAGAEAGQQRGLSTTIGTSPVQGNNFGQNVGNEKDGDAAADEQEDAGASAYRRAASAL
jgi:hypothetical protein